MIIELLTQHHLEFLSLKGGWTDLSKFIHVKMPHCRKSHVSAHELWHDFQQCGILANVDSDEPVQTPFKHRHSKCCSLRLSSLKFIEYSSDKQRLCLDWEYAQAGLSICWSHIPHCWKSHAPAQIYFMAVFLMGNIIIYFSGLEI